MVELGATEAVLTAKHGCGFYLWDTNVTLPDGTPYRYHVNLTTHGDVLRQIVEATSARNIGHGFYYSLTNNVGKGARVLSYPCASVPYLCSVCPLVLPQHILALGAPTVDADTRPSQRDAATV